MVSTTGSSNASILKERERLSEKRSLASTGEVIIEKEAVIEGKEEE